MFPDHISVLMQLSEYSQCLCAEADQDQQDGGTTVIDNLKHIISHIEFGLLLTTLTAEMYVFSC